MLEIVIIGSGNVAQHLIQAFTKSNQIDVAQVFARNPDSVSHLIEPSKVVKEYDQLKEVPLYLIAVSDKAIAEVSSSIPYSGRIVLHTSGSSGTGILDPKNTRGAFYPVQTFSKGRQIDFRQVPIGIEIENEVDYGILEELAQSVSDRVFRIDSKQRKALHVAAVFVNNFTNHLYQLGSEICGENAIPFEILQPLVLETADKIVTLSPQAAQTGPARRKDMTTIATHLEFLTDSNKKKIYELLTQSIIDNGKKL